MLKIFLGAAAGSGSDGRLSTLIFHRVLRKPDPLFPGEIDADSFARICGWLRSWFNVLPLPEALRRLDRGELPPRACAITFDDGYADNFEIALPILAAHDLSATFFITTGYLDGGRMWNDTVIEAVRATLVPQLDLGLLPGGGEEGLLAMGSSAERRSAIVRLLQRIKYLPVPERIAATERLAQLLDVRAPQDLMLTSSQLRRLHAAGMSIGAHTVMHPILAGLSPDAARQEIMQSKTTLEQLLDTPVGLFAYPNGKPGTDYSAESVALVRAAGFDAALSTAWGAADGATDRFQIPRFTPWDRSRWRFGLRMLGNLRRRETRPALLAV